MLGKLQFTSYNTYIKKKKSVETRSADFFFLHGLFVSGAQPMLANEAM